MNGREVNGCHRIFRVLPQISANLLVVCRRRNHLLQVWSPPIEAPGTPALTDIQVADHEGGSNHQQMGPESAGLVHYAAQLRGGGGPVVIAMVMAGPLSSC